MRATGIVRQVDQLGRIVLPLKLRHDVEIKPNDDIEIYVDGRDILLPKFWGGHDESSKFQRKLICQDCRTSIAGLFGRAAD